MDKNLDNKTNNDTLNDTYWKSLDEKYQTPEFKKLAETEFTSSPLKEEDNRDGLARRQFMKLMGASMALSATACVKRPIQKIIPYNKRPLEIVPGIANYYASSWYDGTEGFSTLVKTREGRPLHLQGNPDFPLNGTGLSVRASAHILSLYDPDRIKAPTFNSIENKAKRRNSMAVASSKAKLDEKVGEQLKKGGVYIWSPATPSPSSEAMIDAFAKAVGAKRMGWDISTNVNEMDANDKCFGKPMHTHFAFEKAKFIVSIDGDFLGVYKTPVSATKSFAQARRPEGEMASMVSFQSVPSLTSLNADDNYSIKSSQQLDVVLGLIHEITHKLSDSDAGLRAATTEAGDMAAKLGIDAEKFSAVAEKLWKNRGKSIVVAGGLPTEHKDGLGLHVAVNALNGLLGNFGSTVKFSSASNFRNSTSWALSSLIDEMKAGNIKTLIINGVNPAYQLPKSLELDAAFEKVEMIISTANLMDETASRSDVVMPAGHAMENWNDFEFASGLFSIQQPTISPLYDTRSFEDSLMAWAKAAGKSISSSETYFAHLKSKWVKKLGSEKAWNKFLQEGFSGSSGNGKGSSFKVQGSALKLMKKSEPSEGLELALYKKVPIGDGSLANVSWLQELPDPVSKVAWDNYLMVSVAYAKDNSLKSGDQVEVKSKQHKATLPVLIMPGMHKEMFALAIGYGRKLGGEILKNVGFDAIPFADGFNFSALKIDIKKVKGQYPLAMTQGHHNMMGRQLVAEANYKSYSETGNTGIHRHKIFSIWEGHKYENHKWGMSIDLNSCTGCSACMVACQSENNIPTVGKKYILEGRQMSWIRIDRYYKGDESGNPDAVFQPVMCQHCENAPCETVCPVLATVHSDEGLNDMVYNRCVGTRYCANNCPYKVRRFNWFYYDSHHKKEPLHMALNPDVTVRTRGVMEKCSFCVHRIKEGKNRAKDEKRKLQDGDIKTACEAVCPTDAITFGDLNDKSSRVSQRFASDRNYTLLEEFNAAPRVRYLAKLRNTDRDMGGHGSQDGSHAEKADHGTEDSHAPKDKHGDEAHGQEHGTQEGH